MSLIIRTDVTAVKFYRSFVLAGIGSSIHVFEKDSGTLVRKIYCLNGQKIYGIEPLENNENILIFGGKQFTVITLKYVADVNQYISLFERLFKPVVCDDWIHSINWLDNVTVAILTAHNVVQKWNTSTQTLISQNLSKDNSILYSGLLVPLLHDVLVLAGTVFSEVIIHRCGDERPLHHLKGHCGVIFSISYNLQRGVIVTTSDDRSVRIWALETTIPHPCNTFEYWKSVKITLQHSLYGHTARVMRNCITKNYIISVGEDSAICFWDYKGKLLKKKVTHQNGCIWSVDADEHHLVTGGGECGVILHPLSIIKDYGHNEVLKLDGAIPKKVVFTARRNLVIINENNELTHIDIASGIKTIHRLNHESTYKLLSISSCKQMIAVIDISGKLDVFVESCKDNSSIQNVINTKLNIGKALSMQWVGNRYLILCAGYGAITVLASKDKSPEVFAKFILPTCKERWLTASAIDAANNVFTLGDRCGNIHVYVKGQKDPIKSFSKVHGRYGPTSITINDNKIVTTGRDGTIKYFAINGCDVTFMNSKDVEFQWVERFLDKDDNIVCGFQEKAFVVHNVKSNSKVLEVPCGGGHRSWDAIRSFDKINNQYEEIIRLVYLKNSDVNLVTFEMSKIISKSVINGSHSKEINCMKTYKRSEEERITFYISGGEDTTLRISSINSELQFQDEIVFKQLSNIRTLKIHLIDVNNLLLMSAGGRAQICVKLITITKHINIVNVTAKQIIDYLIKGTDKEKKGNQSWRNCSIDFDPETRIMDLDFISTDSGFTVFVGCSDACLRVYYFKTDDKMLTPIKDVKYHKTCILKTHCIKHLDKDILVTCTTRGDMTLWDVTDVKDIDLQPFFSMKTNKSGINSIASKIISDKGLLIATGGDDNAVHLNALEIPDRNNLSSIKLLHSWSSDKIHSSQITGLCIVDNFVVSTSIDQRITLLEWAISDLGVTCTFLSQAISDVADIQGMELVENSLDTITVCVFGKGMEVIEISKPNAS